MERLAITGLAGISGLADQFVLKLGRARLNARGDLLERRIDFTVTDLFTERESIVL